MVAVAVINVAHADETSPSFLVLDNFLKPKKCSTTQYWFGQEFGIHCICTVGGKNVFSK